MNYEHTAEYEYINIALKARWQPFCALANEMETFVPRPISDFEDERDKQIAHYRQLNPTLSDESLTDFVDKQIAFTASEHVQFHNLFSDRFMAEYVMVTLLSHALCEAVINAILAIGLAHSNSEALFSLIERAEIKEKWCIAPKCLLESYELPRHTALFETLDRLTKQRNAFVHHKIQLHVNGKKIFEGSKLERQSFPDAVRWLKRYFSLPYDLANYARIKLPGLPIMVLFESSPIKAAIVHRTPNNAVQQTVGQLR